MAQEANILNRYLHSVATPNFNDFIKKNIVKIENASINIICEKALELERHWANEYNKAVRLTRSDQKLQTRVFRARDSFVKIFEITKEKRYAQHNFKASSIRFAGEVLRVSSNAEREEDGEEDNEDGKEKDDKEEDDKEEDDKEEDGKEEENEKEHERKNINLSKYLKSNSSDDNQLNKLGASSCLNFINSKYTSFYSEIVPQVILDQVRAECIKKRLLFPNKLDENLKTTINSTFDGLLQYQHDTNLNNILTYIDDQKQAISNKFSISHNLLSIVELVIRSFTTYLRESKLSEAFYLRKFQEILDVVLAQTKIETREGETVSRSTRNMLIMNQEHVEYGRRIDLLVTSDGLDEADDDTELCSIEFKKHSVPENVLVNQQGKNIRINACILNQNHLILNNSDSDLLYYDFTGRNAYLAQLFPFDDCYVAHKVGNFTLPKSLLELGQFRQSIIQLYTWKNETEKKNNEISLARFERQNRFALSGIATDVVCISPPRSPYNVEPVKVFLSPSKGKKRTRGSIFVDEQ